MKVKFYIPKDETIPTRLRLKVDERDVYYERAKDKFAYDFQFFETEKEDCLKIAEELAQIMSFQSEDHGKSWRVTDISIVEQEEKYAVGTIVRVSFRIRDSY